MPSPKIDTRNSADIQEELLRLAPHYLPEWKPAQGESGWAVARAFSTMAEEVITRLNGVPDRLVAAYLERLGYRLAPPLAARAPITFALTEGFGQNRAVPAATRVATEDQVIFETETAFSATPAKPVALLSVDPGRKKGEVLDHSDLLRGGESVTLFSGSPEEPEHLLYVGDDELFNVNRGFGTDLDVTFYVPFKADWQYWGSDAEGTCGWRDFKGGVSALSKSLPYPACKRRVNGTETFWIRALLDKTHAALQLRGFEVGYRSKSGVDALYHNDTPLEGKNFHPFGLEPKPRDTFYLASNEAFSKRGFSIVIAFKRPKGHTCAENREPAISWEYWNGNAWKALKERQTGSSCFPSIVFTCPEDIEPTAVNGETHFWIRAKLVGGGYGTYQVVETAAARKGYEVVSDFDPPEVEKIQITIPRKKSSPQAKAPQHLVAYNHFDYEALSGEPVQPYVPLSDTMKSLYLGFDRPFGEGLMPLFFSTVKASVDAGRVSEWRYSVPSGWHALNVKDETDGFAKSGICSFVAPADQASWKRFGRTLYWIRAEIATVQRQAEPGTHRTAKKAPAGETPSIAPCVEEIRPFYPPFAVQEDDGTIAFNGIFPNTVWGVQSETVAHETVGSGDGSPLQTFALRRTPVVDLALWVREPLRPETPTVESYADEEGKGYWVRWQEADALEAASAADRLYTADYASGELGFGDGEHGMVPPAARDNILALYRTGGGERGNVGKGKIRTLVSSIASVDGVTNPLAASGGAEAETVTQLAVRAPKRLRHRFRAVNTEDYVSLAMEASGNVARAACLANFDGRGEHRPGWTTVVIVPRSEAAEPAPSPQLLKRVETYLTSRAPVVAVVRAVPPVYARVDVAVAFALSQWEAVSQIKQEALEKLSAFLHPLSGGYEGAGWPFGTMPCFSDFFSLFAGMEGVDHIETMTVTVRTENERMTLNADEGTLLELPPYLLICDGSHTITTKGV